MDGTKEYWSMTEGVYNCLIDKTRTDAFQKAIQNTVKEGDVVVDMGTGSGVLAMFAAKCGAKKVYAVEFDTNNHQTLKYTFQLNGYGDVIEVVFGDIRTVSFPEKIDVIIGEMIATGLIEELQIPAMNNVLQYAQKDVRVVLNHFNSYIDLVHNPDEFYGHRFKIVRYEYPEIADIHSTAFSEKVVYSEIDFSKVNSDIAIEKEIYLTVIRDGSVNGLRISSQTIFSDGSAFDASFAYSYPIILPIDDCDVLAGDIFVVNISYELCGGFDKLRYSFFKK